MKDIDRTRVVRGLREMRWLVWLAWRELWSWRWRSTLSLLALALSVGLVAATGGIGAQMAAALATPAPLLGRPADLWVANAYDVDYDLPAALAAKVEAVPGIAQVQPVLRRPVRVRTPRPDTLALLGVQTSRYFGFHDLALAAGSWPASDAPGWVALAPWAVVHDLRLGQPVTVTTPSGEVALPVVGLVEVKSLAAAQQGLVLYAPLDTAADLFEARSAVTVLEVRLAPGASLRSVQRELDRALGPAYAVSTAAQFEGRTQLWQRLVLGALAFVDGLALVGGVVLTYAVLAAAARSRRQRIGLLRAAGARRGQVWALLIVEALLLGLGGSGAGLLLGLALARGGSYLVLQDALAAQPALPLAGSAGVPARSLLLATGLGLVGSLAGGLVPARRAARQPPLAAVYEASVRSPLPSRGRPGKLWHLLLRGARPLALTCLYAWTWIASPGRGKRTREEVRRSGVEMRLALPNLARERGRGMGIVAALALILAMAVGNVGVLSLLGEELAATFGRLSGGDYLVLPQLTAISLRELAGQDTSDAPPLDPGLLASLGAMQDQVRLMGGTTADVKPLQVFPGQPTLLLDIDGYAQMGGFRFLEGDWAAALRAFDQGPAVLLAPVVARRLDARAGDQVVLDTLQGPVAFTVAGIGDSEFTTCVLDLADGAAYFGANEVNAVEVQVRPSTDPQAVRRALLDAVHTYGGTLLPLDQAVGRLRDLFRGVRLSIGLLIGITGLVAGLGVLNAMLTGVAERRREIGLLRAAGATRAQVSRLILVEAATLGVIAALIGTVLGWAVTMAFLGVARSRLGLGGEGTVSLAAWLPLIATSAAALVLWPALAMLGGWIPARHAARLPVVEALYKAAPG
jgi:putative ABC transport system permease protein